ncbi:MAG: phosphoglycerate dehydrogenase [Actinomycetota bacterium]|nr:phosphoglycerate dehydrogenase [Actinomycetota bacterium]
MRPKVVVAEPVAEAALEALAEHCRVDLAVGADRDELSQRLSDAQALVVRSGTKVDAELIEAAPQLRVIGRAGIGVDNIDLDAATSAGVLVVNAPQANVISAAEQTLALLLAQARNIPRADASLRSGNWDRTGLAGVELHGKTLGILGLGRVGSQVAERAGAFGMRVIGYDPYVSPERARRLGVELTDDLARLFAEADFITLHLPLTRETEGLVGRDSFELMKPGVRIVNTSRGGVVDEEALAEAVRSGRVAGAALDVFSQEPLVESPLLELPQVVLTPHLGAATHEAQDKAGTSVAEAVAAALRGELVPSAVNVDLGREVSEEVRPYLPLVEQMGRVLVGLARGLPERLEVRAEGRLAEHPVRPLALAALKGLLASVTSAPVSYVNAPQLAESRGLRVAEHASPEARDYVALVRLSGLVGARPVSLAGTLLGRKGPVLVEILGYEIELSPSRYLLMVRNDDVPGVIGRVGTYLGDRGVNIANMVVGRSPAGEAAMMGLNLDQPVGEDDLQRLRALRGVNDARFVELPVIP